MYQVNVTTNENDSVEFFNTKREVVTFIAKETGMSQREVSEEIKARTNSSFNRDNLGFRVEVYYS